MLLREKTARACEDSEKAWSRLALQHHKLVAENNFYRAFVRVFDPPGKEQLEHSHGPLRGLSFAAKDNMAVSGHALSFGIQPEVLPQAATSAEIVAQLQQAGACVFGSTNLDPLCLSHDGDNPFFGRVVNPIDAALPVLGSSCGAAASVARGQIDFALGTDFGGSIRLPAASCGLCGFKASPAFLPRQGVLLLSDTLDACGVLTKHVDDVAYLIGSLGHVVPSSQQLSGITVFVPASKDLSAMDETIRCCFLEFLANLQERVAVKELEISVPFEAILETRKIIAIEHSVKALAQLGVDSSSLPAAARALCLYYRDLSVARRAAAVCQAQEVCALFHKMLDSKSFLLTPTLPTEISPLGASIEANQDRAPLNVFLALANLCQLPALAVPTSLKHGNLPFSVQLVGSPQGDLELIAAAVEIQENTSLFV